MCTWGMSPDNSPDNLLTRLSRNAAGSSSYLLVEKKGNRRGKVSIEIKHEEEFATRPVLQLIKSTFDERSPP